MSCEIDDSSLIFADKQWVDIANCVWNSAIPLPGKIDVQHTYPGLKSFFVDLIGVTTASAPVLLKALEDFAKEVSTNFKHIKHVILQLGDMIDSYGTEVPSDIDEKLESLRDLRILPVLQNGTTPLLMKNKDRFFIADHVRYGRQLSAHITVLDFDVEQLAVARPFLAKLGLVERLLSENVEEVTKVPICSENTILTQDFRSRIYALSS